LATTSAILIPKWLRSPVRSSDSASGNSTRARIGTVIQEALRGLIEAKLKGMAIRPQAVSTPPPVIDLMAALKRSLAQEIPATGSASARERRAKPTADRRQRSLLLPVAGGGRRKAKPAIDPAAAMRPRKKA